MYYCSQAIPANPFPDQKVVTFSDTDYICKEISQRESGKDTITTEEQKPISEKIEPNQAITEKIIGKANQLFPIVIEPKLPVAEKVVYEKSVPPVDLSTKPPPIEINQSVKRLANPIGKSGIKKKLKTSPFQKYMYRS